MKTIRLALLSFAAVLGSLVASAQQAPAEAFIASVSGAATVTAPGSTKATPVVAGEKLPEGSTVKTSEGGSVLIQSHQGIQTGVGSKSTVTIGTHGVSSDGVRTAVIDLKEGTTVSVLDPSKRAVNNYAVRTPKGVAAARGTTYSTTVTLSSGGEAVVTVNTLTGAVSFSIVGGATISVTEGHSASSNSSSATTIAAAIAAASPEQKQDIAEALTATVSVVAIIAQASPATGDTNAAATLASVTAVVNATIQEVAATNPDLATSLTADVRAASNPGPVTVITSPDGTTTINQPSPAPGAAATPAIDITVVPVSQSQ